MKLNTFFRRGTARHFGEYSLAVIVCAILSACGGGSDTADQTSASQAENTRSQAMAAVTEATWSRLTDSAGGFHLATERTVRYGTGASWVKARLSGTYLCETATFGIDPAPGQTKVCEIKDTRVSAGMATLIWSASRDADLAGYRVYYGTSSRNYIQPAGTGIDARRATSFVVAGLPAGALHYFTVTAVNSSGNESDASNEVSKVIQ